MSVQEAQWRWNSELLSYDPRRLDKLVEGLRRAGVPEGAGTDVPIDRYMALVKSRGDGRFDVTGASEIETMAAGRLYDRGARFIDIRTRQAYAKGHIPGAINLSAVFDLSREALMKVADPEDEVVFYCNSKYCTYSAFAAAKAVAWGYTKVHLLAEGLPEWEADHCPVEVASSQ